MYGNLFCLGMCSLGLFICLFVLFWFCSRFTIYFFSIIVNTKKKISLTDGSTKRPCFPQFFRFTINGHIERDSACLTDQDGSLLYVLCKRNVTKWEYTQVRGQISSSSIIQTLLSIVQNYLFDQIYIEYDLPWDLRYIVRMLRAITRTVTNCYKYMYMYLVSLHRNYDLRQIWVKYAYITSHLSCNWYFCWKLILLTQNNIWNELLLLLPTNLIVSYMCVL